MSSPAWCANAFLLLAVAGGLGSQTTRPAANPWFAGWLAETLDRDFATARDLYARASADDNLAIEHRLLATMRMAEFQLASGQPQAMLRSLGHFRQLQQRAPRVPLAPNRETERAWEPLAAIANEFRETLALADASEREARLPELRQRVRAFVAGTNVQPEPRPWLHMVLRGLMQQLAARGEAREPGPPRTLVEFRKGSRLRAAEVARLRLDGHVEQAQRLETLPIRQPGGMRPRGLGQGNPQEVLARALRRINEALQRERRADLYAVERTTLELLRDRLLAKQAAGEHAEGVELLRSLVIYNVCFLADGR